MNLRNIGVVYRKELRDMLRDRRTIINAILIPLLAFPVLLVGFVGVAIFVASRATEKDLKVMILNEAEAPEVAQRIRRELSFVMVQPSEDYVDAINNKRLHLAVEFPAQMEEKIRTAPAEPHTVKLYHFEGQIRSTAAARRVERIVNAYRDEVIAARLESRGLDRGALEPFTFEKENAASADRVTGSILGFLLPYFVILLSLTGAMYPALDLTAGEKERGTMETILASPVHRGDLVAGKFLLTLTFSLVTTSLSIVSLAATVLGGAGLIGQVSKGFVFAVSGTAISAVLFLLLPVTVLFSAGLMAIAVYARNYRDAQNYLAPLMFVVILPAMASMVPGMELNARLALVPILNISLAAREILTGQYQWGLIALIFGSTAAYAAGALVVVARQFNREEVIFRV